MCSYNRAVNVIEPMPLRERCDGRTRKAGLGANIRERTDDRQAERQTRGTLSATVTMAQPRMRPRRRYVIAPTTTARKGVSLGIRRAMIARDDTGCVPQDAIAVLELR